MSLFETLGIVALAIFRKVDAKSRHDLMSECYSHASAYVDLNLIRTRIAKTSETSDYRRAKSRTEALKSNKQPAALIESFVGSKPDKIGLHQFGQWAGYELVVR